MCPIILSKLLQQNVLMATIFLPGKEASPTEVVIEEANTSENFLKTTTEESPATSAINITNPVLSVEKSCSRKNSSKKVVNPIPLTSATCHLFAYQADDHSTGALARGPPPT